MFKVTIINT